MSGAQASRPGFHRALDALIDGDTLVITMLDQLGRSTQNMLAFADELSLRRVVILIESDMAGSTRSSSPVASVAAASLVSSHPDA